LLNAQPAPLTVIPAFAILLTATSLRQTGSGTLSVCGPVPGDSDFVSRIMKP